MKMPEQPTVSPEMWGGTSRPRATGDKESKPKSRTRSDKKTFEKGSEIDDESSSGIDVSNIAGEERSHTLPKRSRNSSKLKRQNVIVFYPNTPSQSPTRKQSTSDHSPEVTKFTVGSSENVEITGPSEGANARLNPRDRLRKMTVQEARYEKRIRKISSSHAIWPSHRDRMAAKDGQVDGTDTELGLNRSSSMPDISASHSDKIKRLADAETASMLSHRTPSSKDTVVVGLMKKLDKEIAGFKLEKTKYVIGRFQCANCHAYSESRLNDINKDNVLKKDYFLRHRRSKSDTIMSSSESSKNALLRLKSDYGVSNKRVLANQSPTNEEHSELKMSHDNNSKTEHEILRTRSKDQENCDRNLGSSQQHKSALERFLKFDDIKRGSVQQSVIEKPATYIPAKKSESLPPGLSCYQSPRLFNRNALSMPTTAIPTNANNNNSRFADDRSDNALEDKLFLAERTYDAQKNEASPSNKYRRTFSASKIYHKTPESSVARSPSDYKDNVNRNIFDFNKYLIPNNQSTAISDNSKVNTTLEGVTSISGSDDVTEPFTSSEHSMICTRSTDVDSQDSRSTASFCSFTNFVAPLMESQSPTHRETPTPDRKTGNHNHTGNDVDSPSVDWCDGRFQIKITEPVYSEQRSENGDQFPRNYNNIPYIEDDVSDGSDARPFEDATDALIDDVVVVEKKKPVEKSTTLSVIKRLTRKLTGRKSRKPKKSTKPEPIDRDKSDTNSDISTGQVDCRISPVPALTIERELGGSLDFDDCDSYETSFHVHFADESRLFSKELEFEPVASDEPLDDDTISQSDLFTPDLSRRRDSKYIRLREKRKNVMQCCKRFVAFLFSHIGLCSLVVGYSIMGGFLFRAIEGPEERVQQAKVRGTRLNAVYKIRQLAFNIEWENLDAENFTTLVEKELKDFQDEIYKATKEHGWEGEDDEGNSKEQWNYAASLLYAITVMTTIGYGHVAPKTEYGRLVTIGYAVLGIPLTLLCLTNIGDLMADGFRLLYGKVCCGLCCFFFRVRRRHMIPDAEKGEVHVTQLIDEEDANKPKEVIHVPTSLCMLLITGYIFAGALLFSLWEGWDYLTGSYFCFITLSTIGFGDIVPGMDLQQWAQQKLVLCALYLITGLSLIAMCFTLVQEDVKAKCRWIGEKIGIIEKTDPL